EAEADRALVIATEQIQIAFNASATPQTSNSDEPKRRHVDVTSINQASQEEGAATNNGLHRAILRTTNSDSPLHVEPLAPSLSVEPNVELSGSTSPMRGALAGVSGRPSIDEDVAAKTRAVGAPLTLPEPERRPMRLKWALVGLAVAGLAVAIG